MRFEHTHHREPAAIGDANEASAAVVVWDVVYEPVDGVVGVRSFVNARCFGSAIGIANGTLHNEGAFGTVASANILEDKNVVVGNHLSITAEDAAVTLVIVMQTIRGAFNDDGKRLGG